jgi:thiamine pyrophosphokinase
VKQKDVRRRDGAKILSFSVDKDKTDLELALETTKELNVESITIIGGEGKELDHLFSNFLKLSSFKQHGTIKWITKVENIIFNTQMVFEVEKNKVFSILPLSDLDSLSIKGSKWDILNEDIPYGSSRTLRNITLSNEIEVHCKNGNFCLIIKN